MPHVKPVAILGAGIIGSSWAMVFARGGLNVRIWERTKGAGAIERIGALIRNLKGSGLEGDELTLDRLEVFGTLEQTLDGVQYVQESVSENLDIKQSLFDQIEKHVDEAVVIASSTSGLLPSELATRLAHPERLLVAHPLTPPHLLPIVEVCPSPKTASSAIATTMRIMNQVGQRPMLLKKEIAGFVLNRILAAMMHEFFALIDDDVLEPEDIDAAMTDGFGLRWSTIGPLAAMDLNAPGGIRDYLDRYGTVFNRVPQSRGAKPVLHKQMIERLGLAVDLRYGAQDRAVRAAGRDMAIAMVRRLRLDLGRK